MKKPTPDIPELETFKKLISKGAWYCYKRLPNGYMEFRDLISEGQLVYFEFVRDFDPARGAQFITGLWWRLRSRFAGILHKGHLDQKYAPATLDPLDYAPAYPRVSFQETRTDNGNGEWLFWMKPSKKAQEVAQEILASKDKFSRKSFFERSGIGEEAGREILLELAHCLSPGFGQ